MTLWDKHAWVNKHSIGNSSPAYGCYFTIIMLINIPNYRKMMKPGFFGRHGVALMLLCLAWKSTEAAMVPMVLPMRIQRFP